MQPGSEGRGTLEQEDLTLEIRSEVGTESLFYFPTAKEGSKVRVCTGLEGVHDQERFLFTLT